MSDARFVDSGAPDRVQAAMHDTLLLAAQARLKEEGEPKQMIFDEQGRLSPSNSLAAFPMRLGGRVVYGASMFLNDDPGDHGQESKWLMIVDEAGRSRSRVKDVPLVRLVVDVNRDGNDELLTMDALTFYTGTRWQIVRGWGANCDQE
jgi:hypothetical protein